MSDFLLPRATILSPITPYIGEFRAILYNNHMKDNGYCVDCALPLQENEFMRCIMCEQVYQAELLDDDPEE